ncbi:MAG: hypothetical protein M3018_01340 [Actinomycetota bacterium]|nr:hypothetical protein [Actinomycetota bacterium]
MRLRFWFVGCCVLIVGCGSAVASDLHAKRPAARDDTPRVLSVAYVRVRPPGATGAYYAVNIRARDPDGQIVSWMYAQVAGPGNSQGAIGDGACGLGGRRNGHIYTSPLGITKLRSGIYRLRVRVEASSCTRDARSESASRTFTIHVP